MLDLEVSLRRLQQGLAGDGVRCEPSLTLLYLVVCLCYVKLSLAVLPNVAVRNVNVVVHTVT